MRAPTVLGLGFRWFFLLGVTHAVAVMALWVAVLHGAVSLPLGGMAPIVWHGHEMLMGFARAIVAGFLLTAVRNWTGRETLTGWPLGALGLLWLGPRLGLTLGGPTWLPLWGLLDVVFGIALFAALARPVVAARQARHGGILAKILLLVIADAVFYGGVTGRLPGADTMAITADLYLLVALVITLASRVVPAFVRSALPEAPAPAEHPWRDRTALTAFVLLAANDLTTHDPTARAALAALLAGLHGVRLWGWWTPQVRTRTLLWVLFLGYGWNVVGFALMALSKGLSLPAPLPLHALLVGGLGVTVIGMVARVSLGHTGRDVRQRRPMLGVLFVSVALAALVRVVGPWMAPEQSLQSWTLAGVAWVAAFFGLLVWGLPLWLRPRPDGRPG